MMMRRITTITMHEEEWGNEGRKKNRWKRKRRTVRAEID